MNKPESALERLMNQQKPKVPEREDGVSQGNEPERVPVHKPLTVGEAASLDTKTARQQDLNNERKTSREEGQKKATRKVKRDSNLQPEESLNPDNFETVRNTIRLEMSVDSSLRQLCSEERITKETWIEAAYVYLAQNPEAMEAIVSLATERLGARKRIADHRRAVAMQGKLLT